MLYYCITIGFVAVNIILLLSRERVSLERVQNKNNVSYLFNPSLENKIRDKYDIHGDVFPGG